jgi:DNA-binding CsgD family transcriptional regulator
MDEMLQLSSIIGDIYDAALDPDHWEYVLESTCKFFHGMFGGLGSFDRLSNKLNMSKNWGYDPKFLQSYVDHYSKINVLAIASMGIVKAGDVITNNDLMSEHEWHASRIYREWARPQGVGDSITAVLEKTNIADAGVSFFRHERDGLFDEGARRRMRLLLPHFRRAVLIGKVIDLHKVEAAALADALDGLAAAMILVDANGRIVHANAAGQAMLSERAVLRGTGGKLSCVDARADAALHEIIMNAEGSEAALGGMGAAVPLTARESERYVAHVLPLTSGARRKAKVAYSAVAAVFVRKAELDAPHPIDVLAKAFDLTPAELRVVMMIVQVGGVPEVAPILGISEPTVKTHLQHIFEKTSTSRQADLVKLVASYMSPLAGTPA